MERIWSSLGCFGLALLAILTVLGVTESIRYADPITKALVLTAAVVAAAGIAYVRDWIKSGSVPKQSSKDQASKVDRGAPVPLQSTQPPPQYPQSQQSQSPPQAPITPNHDAILAARRQAILFRQIVPPNHDPAHLSFFGGLPIAPAGFQWPRGDSRPYSFLMQLDCAAVPANGRLGIFPDEGVLYWFLDLEWGEPETFSVIWQPGPSDGWTEIAPPDDLPHAFDSKLAWKWPQSDAEWPRLLPKWPFDPVLIQGGPFPDDPEALEQTYAWPGTVDVREEIAAIDGAVVEQRSLSFERGKARKGRPFATFPHDWNAVRITTGLIAASTNRKIPELRTRFRDLSDDEYAAKVTEFQTTLSAWSDRASTAARFDEVPTVLRDQFWSWVEANDWVTNLPMAYAGNLSVEASLSAGADAAARIPPDVVDYIRSRHALGYTTETGLHIRIPDRMLAAPTDVQGDIDGRVLEFLLLLELSSDEGLAHYFGEGVYQFWIRPNDLAARRFDRVELSSTAY